MENGFRRRAVLAGFGGLAAGGAASAQALDALRWRKRIVLAFAPSPQDDRLRRQREVVQALMRGGDDRDLVWAEVAGDRVEPGGLGDADALRRRYHAPQNGFVVLLIGKDGGVKLRSQTPLTAERLASTIDAMPMRRDEASRGQGGVL